MSRAQRSGALKKSATQLFLKNLQAIRTKGFWINRGEHAPEGFGVGVALFGAGGEVIGSLALSGPLQRLTVPLRDLAVEMLTEAARKIAAPHSLLQLKAKAAGPETGRRMSALYIQPEISTAPNAMKRPISGK